jgi:hypothetical protein
MTRDDSLVDTLVDPDDVVSPENRDIGMLSTTPL